MDLYPPHLPPQQIHDGIKNGKILQGSFVASRDNYLEGSVNVEGYEKFVSKCKIRKLKNCCNFIVGNRSYYKEERL